MRTASSTDNSAKSVSISAEEFVKFSQYQNTLHPSSSSFVALANSGSVDEEDYW